MERTKKFPQVIHHTRGPLLPEEFFVLVPAHDPAAVHALRAYGEHTLDVTLADELTVWCDHIEDLKTIGDPPTRRAGRIIQRWTAILAHRVRAGEMTIETALERIAGHALVLAQIKVHSKDGQDAQR